MGTRTGKVLSVAGPKPRASTSECCCWLAGNPVDVIAVLLPQGMHAPCFFRPPSPSHRAHAFALYLFRINHHLLYPFPHPFLPQTTGERERQVSFTIIMRSVAAMGGLVAFLSVGSDAFSRPSPVTMSSKGHAAPCTYTLPASLVGCLLGCV